MSVPVSPVLPPATSARRPVGVTDVEIRGGFWGHVQDLNRDRILQHCDDSLHRVGWFENFRAAARGTLAADRVGRLFTDSEIYKLVEAMSWEQAREATPERGARIAEIAELIAGAQEPDGYLDTYFGYEGGPERYSDLAWGHELYCAGHLIQAAVAAMRTGTSDHLTDTARRLADHVVETFGPDGIDGICGHPEIETALVELSRATGDRRYLDQAKLFVDRRGLGLLPDNLVGGPEYYQDKEPVREADVLGGHAVRALYLAAGAIDVAVETGDDELFAAVRRQYDRTVARRMYLTGGMGSNHYGESFAEDYELPSERAYAETCAQVASVHVAWRLLLATGEEFYADVIERTLYNGVISAPSIDGRTFFYVNALHRRSPSERPAEGMSLRRHDGQRASWYTTSCCPTNMARLLSSLGAYVATTTDHGVQLHQHVSGRVSAELPAGRVVLDVKTEYPVAGEVRVRVAEAPEGEWTLGLRVPAWAQAATIAADGGEPAAVAPGLAETRRQWAPGDEVILTLDVAPRFTYPDPRVDALRGCVAVERGPLVYAVESVDQPEVDLDRLMIDDSVPARDSAVLEDLDGRLAVRAQGRVWADDGLGSFAYGADPEPLRSEPVELRLIPYYLWANRGTSTMRIWAPRGSGTVEAPSRLEG
jgi:uncharacterized protein